MAIKGVPRLPGTGLTQDPRHAQLQDGRHGLHNGFQAHQHLRHYDLEAWLPRPLLTYCGEDVSRGCSSWLSLSDWNPEA